jgi:hypothetical protein
MELGHSTIARTAGEVDWITQEPGLPRISGGQQPGVGPAVLSDIEVARPGMNDDVGYQQTGERQSGYHA